MFPFSYYGSLSKQKMRFCFLLTYMTNYHTNARWQFSITFRFQTATPVCKWASPLMNFYSIHSLKTSELSVSKTGISVAFRVTLMPKSSKNLTICTGRCQNGSCQFNAYKSFLLDLVSFEWKTDYKQCRTLHNFILLSSIIWLSKFCNSSLTVSVTWHIS